MIKKHSILYAPRIRFDIIFCILLGISRYGGLIFFTTRDVYCSTGRPPKLTERLKAASSRPSSLTGGCNKYRLKDDWNEYGLEDGWNGYGSKRCSNEEVSKGGAGEGAPEGHLYNDGGMWAVGSSLRWWLELESGVSLGLPRLSAELM